MCSEQAHQVQAPDEAPAAKKTAPYPPESKYSPVLDGVRLHPAMEEVLLAIESQQDQEVVGHGLCRDESLQATGVLDSRSLQLESGSDVLVILVGLLCLEPAAVESSNQPGLILEVGDEKPGVLLSRVMKTDEANRETRCDLVY